MISLVFFESYLGFSSGQWANVEASAAFRERPFLPLHSRALESLLMRAEVRVVAVHE